MHVLAGLVVSALAFYLAHWAQLSLPYFGLMNPAAMFLLGLGPLGVTLVSHPFKEWRSAFAVLFRAFRHDPHANLFRGSEEMSAIARAVRESRWGDAEGAIARSTSEQVRLLAPHLLGRLEPDALRDAIASSAFRWMSEVKLADELLQGLARLAPAFGMIGTIMGLVELFANMRDSASLGPGMAIALLATLYGLVLCYCFYMPLALRVRGYLSAGMGEQRAIEQAMGLILDGRPVHEVRNVMLDAAGPRFGGLPLGPSPSSEAGPR
ncbi:MotA/TolQ/ExbB proton channel family protein [Myxococcota bacterium]|nr:MotA/TolQ/ExbB proton channel family protein [Myxococcota bacterium]